MHLKIKKPIIEVFSATIGALMLATTSAHAQYDDRQAQHAANVRAIQAQRDQHAANAAALNGDYRAADAYARAAAVRRGQAYRDAGAARRLRYEGY